MTDRNPRRSGYLTRLDTRLESFAGTSLFDPGTPAAPGITYPLDAYAAAGGTACNAIWSVSHRLSSSYVSALYRVRRGSGGEQDIGYDAATGLVDLAALTAFCSGTTGFLVTAYDQSGNGRDVTQATTGLQPQVYVSATGPIVVGGLHVAQAVAAGDTRLSRADACGLSASPACSYLHIGRTPTFVADKFIALIGAGGGNIAYNVAATTGNTVFAANSSAAPARREFTSSPATTELNYDVLGHAASANYSAVTIRRNGAALSEAVVSAGLMGIANNLTRVFGATTCQDAQVATPGVFSEDLSGAKLAAFETFGATCRTLAGY
jgi:hypothetical protein